MCVTPIILALRIPRSLLAATKFEVSLGYKILPRKTKTQGSKQTSQTNPINKNPTPH